MDIIVTNIEKKGPVVICTTNDPKGRSYRLDLQKGKIYGISGRRMQSSDPILANMSAEAKRNPFYPIVRVFTYGTDYPLAYYNVIESLMSCIDICPVCIVPLSVLYVVNNCDGKLPKGYVTWCRENDKVFTRSSLEEFLEQQTFKTWPQHLITQLKHLHENMNYNLAREIEYSQEKCVAILRIINNSLKRYEITDIRENIQRIVYKLKAKPESFSYLDETKTLTVAFQILEDQINKARNDKVLANEAKIAALNNTKINNLIIKIPSTMMDFTEEGQQQRNCVGYYYHDFIAEGEQLIYFLRRINKPDISYVTCRFDVNRKATVESRIKCNDEFCDNELFEKIDAMIKAQLFGI